MRLLIGGSPSKIFHLKEFEDALIKLGIECKLVIDTDICNGFPSRKISDWFQTQKKFDKLISDFKPDVILVDRQRHFAKIASKNKIPLIIHLRGNIWKEIEWAKETTYKSFLKKIALDIWISIAKETFDKSFLIIPICKHLEKIVKEKFPNYNEKCKYRVVVPPKSKNIIGIPFLEILDEENKTHKLKISSSDFLTLTAATSIKHRVRMTLLYFHGEKNNFSVVGTTNKSEYQQGYFVKYGDGGSDIEPLVNIYKSQIYQIGKFLEIPNESIC